MITNVNIVHENDCKCLAWKPIFAGALVALGLSFLLNLFGVAIGLTAYTADSNGVENLAFGGLIGICIGLIASMFAAGWLTGYLGQRHCNLRHIGALYGFLTWCLALVFAVFMAGHIQEYVSVYSHTLSGQTIVVNNTAANTVAATTVSNKNVMISTYITFILFFLGAFASSLGGHMGMRHTCKTSYC